MRYLRHETGLVSLLTTIFFSLLVMVITLSMIAIGIRTQRQATDSDQSVRAYYAAQAGTEDAILKIKAAPGSWPQNPSCASLDLGVSAVEVTCQAIYSVTNELIGGVGLEVPAEIDMHGHSFAKVEISWNDASGASGYQTDSNYTGNPNNFPKDDRPWRLPAAIELTAIGYNQENAPGVGTRPDQISVQTVLLRPHQSGSPTASISTPALKSVNCNSGGYSCKLTLDGFDSANKWYFIRMRPRYNGTNYQMRFLDSSGQEVSTPGQTVTVDVTARAGDIFRRIVSKVPIDRPGVFGGLDYVLFSDTNICKSVQTSGDTVTQAIFKNPC